MILRKPLKNPANCKHCKYAMLSENGSQAYCPKKEIYKKVKYLSCKFFVPQNKNWVPPSYCKEDKGDNEESWLTEEEKAAIRQRNLENPKISSKLRERYKKNSERP